MRRAQVWSADFAFSLLIFFAVSVIAFTMIMNSLNDNSFAVVEEEAIMAANLLVSEGYPQGWVNGSVIRAGLQSNDYFSLRKAQELADVDDQQLRRILRITSDVYIYITNGSNETVAMFGQCGVGMTNVTSTPRNLTLPAAAVKTNAKNVTSVLNVTLLSVDELYANSSLFDVIIIEGNLSGNISSSQIQQTFEQVSRQGVTIIVIGDPGISLFGIAVNATVANSVTLQGDVGAPLGFDTDEVVTVNGNMSTILPPSGASHFTPVGLTDTGAIAYATWVHNDARIWYVASSYGSRLNGLNVSSTLNTSIMNMVVVPRPICDAPNIDADQIAVHTRSLAYHDQLLKLHVLAWRTT